MEDLFRSDSSRFRAPFPYKAQGNANPPPTSPRKRSRPSEDLQEDLDDKDINEAYDQAMTQADGASGVDLASRRRLDDDDEGGVVDQEVGVVTRLKQLLEENERRLQSSEKEKKGVEKKLCEKDGETSMLRDCLSQQEKGEKKKLEDARQKYENQLQQLCMEMEGMEKDKERLQTKLQFEAQDKENALSKAKQLEKEKKQLEVQLESRGKPSGTNSRSLRVSRGSQNRFIDGTAFRKSSKVVSSKAIGVQCIIKEESVGDAGTCIEQEGLDNIGLSPTQSLHDSLLMSPCSDVFFLLRPAYQAKCPGTLFSLAVPVQVSGMKSEAKKMLSFSSPFVELKSNFKAEPPPFSPHNVLSQIMDQSLASSASLLESLGQSSDGCGAELRLLPYIEKYISGYLNNSSSSTSLESSTTSKSSGSDPMSDDGDFVDEFLVCLVNALLVLKTLVVCSGGVRKVLIGSRFVVSIGSSPSLEWSSNGKMEEGGGTKPNAFAPKNCSTPQATEEFIPALEMGQVLRPHQLFGELPFFLTAKRKTSFGPDVLTPPCGSAFSFNSAKASFPAEKNTFQRISGLSSIRFGKMKVGAVSSMSLNGLSSHLSHEMEETATTLMSHLLHLVCPKQEEIQEIYLAIPLLCLEILEQLACLSPAEDFSRFVTMIHDGVFVACLCSGSYLLQKAAVALLYRLVASKNIVTILLSEADAATVHKLLQLLELESNKEMNPMHYLDLKTRVIQFLTALWNSKVQMSSSFISHAVQSVVLGLHRELMAMNPVGVHASFPCDSELDEARLAFLQLGSSLFYFIWCRHGSFSNHRTVILPFCTHVVCSLLKLYKSMQSEGKVAKIQVTNMQEMFDSDKLGDFSQDDLEQMETN